MSIGRLYDKRKEHLNCSEFRAFLCRQTANFTGSTLLQGDN